MSQFNNTLIINTTKYTAAGSPLSNTSLSHLEEVCEVHYCKIGVECALITTGYTDPTDIIGTKRLAKREFMIVGETFPPGSPYVLYSYSPTITTTLPNWWVSTYEVGKKKFELSNHLGNVLSVVSDNVWANKDVAGEITHFTPDIVAANDYYAFGMIMPGRSYSSDVYKYGFQGQETDSEIKGEGNSVNFKYRIHDPRIGRFLSVDPLSNGYPWNSPYAFAENKVIQFVELEGAEIYLSKAQRVDYGYGSIPTENGGKFIYNSVVSLYNGFVDVFNYAGDLTDPDAPLTGFSYGANKAQRDARISANAIVDYVNENSISEIAGDVGIAFTRIETYEDISGSLIGGALFKVANVGKIGNLMPRSEILISSKNISKIRSYLGDRSMVDYGLENDVMLSRLDKIARGQLDPTVQDINFYNHELIELEIRTANPEMSYKEAHARTLELQGLQDNANSLYTPDALKAGDEFNNFEVTGKIKD